MAKNNAEGITATVLGKRWNLIFTNSLPKEDRGDCDSPKAPYKKIRIRKNLGELDELDTVIHEILHAFQWHLDEKVVEQAAADMSKILWRLGWRKNR